MRAIATSSAFLLIVLHGAAPALAFPASGNVDSQTTLNVRSGAGTDKPVVGTLTDDTAITVECQVWGQSVAGTQRSSPLWDRIGHGRYVADAFIAWAPVRPAVPWCAEGGPASASVAASPSLNVRSGPGVWHAELAQLPQGSPVEVTCQAWGGAVQENALWAQIGDGRFVSDVYVSWAPRKPWLPWCGQEPVVVAPGDTAAFIAAAVGPAQESRRATRVPASVTIAQAILESGWGRSTLTRDDHNYFGMKCFGGPGPVALGCRDYATHECSGTGCAPTSAQFRAYRNGTDSYLDHGRQLAAMSRYAEAMRHTADPNRFAREIHLAGYATSPTYADKLIDLMKQHDLYRYDLAQIG